MNSETRKHIEHLHRAALERDPHERATFLDQSCGENVELRRAVQALLTQSEHGTNPGGPTISPVSELTTQELTPGQLEWPAGPHLGHYRVLAQLGKGAMGVVYLAHDERLGRKIALKMLPVESTRDETRLRRFEREARAASALNHPNVITVHEVGESNGIHFIATEFIEGNTLRRVLATEKVELREKLRIAAQIAAALDSTHRAKVIHRDIKPENIMVRPDGLVKVLDFGLARLTPERASSGDQQVNAIAETQGGMWAGTPRYMSPEQVKGLELDSRSDIFSLGVVLYEMLTERAPFANEKPEELFDAICNEDPAPVTGRELPDELTEIVHRALEKNPDRRFQTAGELQTRLEAVRQKLDREREDNTGFRRHRTKFRVAAVIAALGGIGLIWWLLSKQPQPRPSPTITRLANAKVSDAFVSFSPDGHSIAYSASNDGEQRLWVRALDRDAEPRAVTDGKSLDRYPIWSPDGKRIAFVSTRADRFGIWTVPVAGGQPELIREIDKPRMVLTSWSRKSPAIYFEVAPNVFRLDLTSGAMTEVTGLDAKHTARSFSVSPDESQLAFAAQVGQEARILVMPMGGGKSDEVTSGGGDEISPEWMSDGKTLIYGARSRNVYQIFEVDLSTREATAVTVGDSDYVSIAVSPDSKAILALSLKDNANIYYWDLTTQEEVALTSDFGLQLFPEVTRDGRKMLFQGSDSSIHSQRSVIIKEVDTKRQPSPFLQGAREAKWGRDNDTVAFIQRMDKTQLWVARESGGAPRRLSEDTVLPSGWTNIPFNRISSPYDWSPDGTRIAYCAEAPGERSLKVVSLDGSQNTMLAAISDPTLKISSPMWSPRGDERIAYLVEPVSYSRSGKRSIVVFGKGQGRAVFERDERLRLLGWSPSGAELYVAFGGMPESTQPQEVKLFQINLADGKQTNFATVPAVYLHSVRLSADARHIAMAARPDGRDSIMVTPVGKGPLVRVVNSADPTVFYSGLTWSPDGKRLFYSKQSSWAVASVVENFR